MSFMQLVVRGVLIVLAVIGCIVAAPLVFVIWLLVAIHTWMHSTEPFARRVLFSLGWPLSFFGITQLFAGEKLRNK